MGIDFDIVINMLIPAVVSSIVTLVGIYSSRAVQKAQAKKIDKEADAVEVDSKTETTERLIKAAGNLVEQYSGALERFKQEEVDYIELLDTTRTKLDELDKKVHKQENTIQFLLKTNRELVYIGIEMFKGIGILITQLEAEDIEPLWRPTQDTQDKLTTLEEFNSNGYNGTN